MALTKKQEAWVSALESGKFRKTTGTLTKNGKYCCLGVACVVLDAPRESFVGEASLEGNDDLDSVRVKLRLHDDSGSFNNDLYPFPGKPDVSDLASANDEGASFKEIAKFIRKNAKGLFWKKKRVKQS